MGVHKDKNDQVIFQWKVIDNKNSSPRYTLVVFRGGKYQRWHDDSHAALMQKLTELKKDSTDS